MARPKKAMASQTGHTTINFQEARARAEKKMSPTTNDLLKKRPRELVDANAKKTWDILTDYLTKIAFYGDINVPDVIGYCNAYSAYLKAWKVYKAAKDDAVLQDEAMTLVKKASEEMTRCQNRGGFSASTRIQIGEKETQKEDKQIEGLFGDV